MKDAHPTRPWLVLMMKAPEPGKVKTRLGAEIGSERATELYRRFVELLVEKFFSRTSPGWRPVIAYAPADAASVVRDWIEPIASPDAIFLPQPEGDLGMRLKTIFEKGFEEGASAVVALGADCLEITPAEIKTCFDDLATHDIIMGEAEDGGYWVIGMSGPHEMVFESMPWSTGTLASMTRDKIRQVGLTLADQPRKSDIDTRADLERLGSRTRQRLGLS